jgi:DNA polymerase-3 subunit beta
MKFIVSSSTLLKSLQTVGGVLNSSNTLPILDNFLFEVKGDVLTLSASDLETTMTTIVALDKGDSEGAIAIPARLLLDTLKTFPEQPLTFSMDDRTFGIEISSDYGKYKLTGQNGEEFPRTPSIEEPSKLTVTGEILSKAITKTLFATGNDELRPVMSGVFCQFSPQGLTFVATDAHKLVRYTRTDAVATDPASFIIPKKPLNLLKGLVGNSDDVAIEYNDNNAQFKFGDITLVCRLIDGKYPNYEAVIPSENPNKLTIGRSDILSSVKRVAIFANKTTHQVRLKITGSELAISAEDLDFANEASERLTCSYEGDDMEIGFNSRFLVDMLTNIDASEVVIEMSAPNRAGILLPAGDVNEAEDILMLVMPVMLNN